MKHKLPFPILHRPLYPLVLILGLLIAFPGIAWSHAYPKQSSPSPNAILQQAPSQARILFTEDLEPAFSTLKVTNQQGHNVDRSQSQVDSQQPNVMEVSLKPLQPGQYTVHWHAVARDGHTTHGEYEFQLQ